MGGENMRRFGQQRMGGLWRQPDFLKLWTGQTISELGSRITREGLPLAAVLVLGATPAQMGLLTAVGSIAVLLASLPAGVWVDRLRRKPVMIWADVGRAGLLLTIPVAALTGQLGIGLLCAVIALAGVLTVLFGAAYEAYLPSLVSRENLLEGNSKLAVSSSLAEVLGPGLAGFLIQTITAPLAIVFDSLSFLASVVSLIVIRKPEPQPAAHERRHILREMRDGLIFVWREPRLRALALAGGTRTFFGSFIGVLYSLYAIRELGLSAAALGVTISMGGVGSLIGAVFAERVVNRLGIGRTLILALVVSGSFTFLIPLAGGSRLSSITMLAIAQLCGDALQVISLVTGVSVRQGLTPDRLLGRVSTSTQLLVIGVAPLGALVGGGLAEVIGVRLTLLIASIGIVCAAGWVIFSPVRYIPSKPEYAKIESSLVE
jgi:predicted MFS family arabinose efflux permease